MCDVCSTFAHSQAGVKCNSCGPPTYFYDTTWNWLFLCVYSMRILTIELFNFSEFDAMNMQSFFWNMFKHYEENHIVGNSKYSICKRRNATENSILIGTLSYITIHMHICISAYSFHLFYADKFEKIFRITASSGSIFCLPIQYNDRSTNTTNKLQTFNSVLFLVPFNSVLQVCIRVYVLYNGLIFTFYHTFWNLHNVHDSWFIIIQIFLNNIHHWFVITLRRHFFHWHARTHSLPSIRNPSTEHHGEFHSMHWNAVDTNGLYCGAMWLRVYPQANAWEKIIFIVWSFDVTTVYRF